MKNLLLSVFLCTAITCCIGQQLKTNSQLLGTEQLKKAKNQRTAAWILLGAGVALDVAGIATTISNADGIFNSEKEINHNGEYVLYIAGTAALAGSLTLFIASKKNKKKAALLSLKNEPSSQLQNGLVRYTPIPSLNLKINF